MIKLLKRKIFIREYDFNKIKTKATIKTDRHGALYDRATFVPITKDDLEKEYILHLLTKDENDNKSAMNNLKPTDYPKSYLWDIRKKMYDEDYINWNSRFDDNGYLVVRYNKSTPETKLGWGIFEKDL
jgi:hypothetical protein